MIKSKFVLANNFVLQFNYNTRSPKVNKLLFRLAVGLLILLFG